MPDILSKGDRSARMRLVRQKHTAPELVLRRGLHGKRLRYSLHPKSLPGSPDLVFPRYGVVVFVHGCFWHGHGCRAGRLPTSNVEYWRSKVSANQLRDRRKASALNRLGWRVINVWECNLKSAELAAKTIDRVAARIAARLH
ncbi:MAG: very short patch repair endonuclease [Casimicrobiaceae bacterium]